MKEVNIKNSELFRGFIILTLGFLIFVGIHNSIRYLGLVFFVFGIVYFIRIFSSKSSKPEDESMKSKTRDQVINYRRKR